MVPGSAWRIAEMRIDAKGKALIFKWTSVHFKSYLEKLDQQLLRMADKAGSNQEQNRLQSRFCGSACHRRGGQYI